MARDPRRKVPPWVEYRLGVGNYRAIAHRAGVSPPHVCRVLQGRKGCSLAVAKRIADAAGVSLDTLWYYIVNKGALQRIKGHPTRKDLGAKIPEYEKLRRNQLMRYL